MKKAILSIILSFVGILCIVGLVGCNETDAPRVFVQTIEKTATEGLVDTYTITFTDGSTTTFTIDNGENGRTPVIEIGENGNWFVDGVDTEVKAQTDSGDAGLSAYELYVKYHPDYEGTEEEWVNEFFRSENNLDHFVRQMDVSSYTAELREIHDGVLESDQVFVKSGDNRYWKKIYNQKDRETGDYYLYPVEDFYTTENNDATNPDYILFLMQRDNVWYGTDSDSKIFTELTQCYMRYYQYDIDPAKFERVSANYFKAKQEFVTEVGKAFFYDMDAEHWGTLNGSIKKLWRTEVFNSFELEIVSGNLKVKATSTIEDGDFGRDVIYELVLTKMGVTSLEVPEYIAEPQGGFPSDTIGDCYLKSQGDEVVNLAGYVTAFMPLGENDYKVWLSDRNQERGILVVFQGFGFPYGVTVDRNIAVYGTIDDLDGLQRVLVTRRVDYVLQGEFAIKRQEIKDLSRITTYNTNTVVNLEGVKFDKVSLSDSDTVILTDRGGHTFELRVSKGEVAFFNEMCEHLFAGDDTNLNNVAIAADHNGLYACLTKQSETEPEYGLLLSYSNKTVKERGVSLEDALADLVVHYRGNDGNYVLLERADYTVSCDSYDPTKNGSHEVTVSYGEEEATIQLTIYLPEVRENVNYPTLEETASDILYGLMPSLPSTGDVNILVIPIGFTNTDYDKYGDEEAIKAKLEIAFNDTEGRTGWYSLKEYYQAASYGKLNFNANILDIYQTGDAYDLYSGEVGVDELEYLLDALEYYDDEINYSLYDQNGDLNIDCIYMIYLAPFFDNSDFDQSDMWWAYYYYSEDYKYFDDSFVYGYLWMSYEFFDEPINVVYTPNYQIDEENSLYVAVNCESIIHETGHALGLADYYDYADGGVIGGVGRFAMMHANQGDHDPYSKAILGWTDPTVVIDMDYETTLRSFEMTGDTIILSKTNGGTYFEEYYMIAFYTPTGVNELKSDLGCGLPSVSGVTVWHIDATLCSQVELWIIESVIGITKYNNGDAKHKLIDLVCADGSTDIDKLYNYIVQDKDLYAAGSTVSDLKWYDGTDVGVEIAIGAFTEESGTEQVIITIDY